jgi:predicted nucleotide-binding protein
MKREKTFPQFALSAEGMRKVNQDFLSRAGGRAVIHNWEVWTGDAMWTFDAFEEFIADYRPSGLFQYMATVNPTQGLPQEQVIISRKFQTLSVSVSITGPTREYILAIGNIVDQNLIPVDQGPKPVPLPIRIFIGHGRCRQWRDLKDHLQDQHGYDVEAFETGARAGHSIRDILDDMLNASSIAFLVFTAEDETGDGHTRARQNVIHEAGLFQGKLGFSKATF